MNEDYKLAILGGSTPDSSTPDVNSEKTPLQIRQDLERVFSMIRELIQNLDYKESNPHLPLNDEIKRCINFLASGDNSISFSITPDYTNPTGGHPDYNQDAIDSLQDMYNDKATLWNSYFISQNIGFRVMFTVSLRTPDLIDTTQKFHLGITVITQATLESRKNKIKF